MQSRPELFTSGVSCQGRGPLSPNVSVSTFLFSEPPHPYFVLDEDEEHPGLPREAHGGLMAALPLETPVRRTRLGAAEGLIQAVEGA